MIIIPHSGKMSWTNPPVITLMLILANCFVFFALQGNESEYYHQAQEHYFDSGLSGIEQEAYIKYLYDTGQEQKLAYLKEPKTDGHENEFIVQQEMRSDDTFIIRLKSDEIITPQMKLYSRWKQLRQEYEDILGQSMTYSYGYKPAQGNILNAFTCMFLHGSLMHLVGNMVFLWLVGCMIEMGCNRLIYIMTYLLTGIIATLSFGLIYSDSFTPLIGASGAIAGLMGFYTILFARKKVGIFLSLGFYFTNTKVPAIILLPFWIGNELYQLFLGGPSNVAYTAHLGGLVSGALASLVQKQFLGGVHEVVSEEELEDTVASLMEEGLQHLSDLDFINARRSFEEVLQQDQGNSKALLHLFHMEKQNPGHENFHATANKLLSTLCNFTNNEEECISIYNEYREAATQPGLSADIYMHIMGSLLKKGELEEAATILAYLLKSHAGFPQIPGSLLTLAKAYHKKGVIPKASRCLQVLCRKYPDSNEYRIANSLLTEYNPTA